MESLSSKTFYKVILSSSIFVVTLMVVSMLSTNGNLVGYAVADSIYEETDGDFEFVSCPLAFKQEACIRGSDVKIEFEPIFFVYNIYDNSLIRSTMSWGNQPVCVYQSNKGHNYRLNGKILSGSNCKAIENGFVCEK